MSVTVSRADLESLIGPECAAWLLASFGGQSRYIPKRSDAGQPVEAVVGTKAMQILRESFGGEDVSLPGKSKPTTRKAQIISLLEVGLSHNEIAKQVGCSWRYVAMVKSDMGLSKPRHQSPAQTAKPDHGHLSPARTQDTTP